MKITYLLLSVAPLALLSPAHAEAAAVTTSNAQQERGVSVSKPDESDTVSTGVARARDRLDSATSTSSLKEAEIAKIGARSLGEIFRNIPGMRSAAAGGEGNASITIRGLPLALGGAKFLQLQEDGLPTLEFGDIASATADSFLRADLNLASIESIRGGSASTFASNSPGGIINLISKTGDVEGGAFEATAGLDYGEYRADFDYGAKIDDTLRFHIGGFYRQGEGPRKTGYDAFKGGQVKFNITKTFDGGYIRLYAKYLDDKSPFYNSSPVRVTGTDAKPDYAPLPGFDARNDTLLTNAFRSNLTLDANNNVTRNETTNRSLVKSFGVETQFEVSDWTITERFRYSAISGSAYAPGVLPIPGGSVGPAQAFANALLRGAPAQLSYATGPNAGQVIADPSALNGNGLLARVTNQDYDLQNLNYIVNDLRASRVWNIGDADLTTTVGFYKSGQTIRSLWSWTSTLMDVRGDGQAQLINIAPAAAPGNLVTQGGYFGYGSTFIGNRRRSLYDVEYGVNAPYASFNYHVGKISVGGSIRYDYGTARGSIYSSDLNFLDGGTRVGSVSKDMNGDGVITPGGPETRVQVLPLTQGAPVNYNYHYFSYSTGVNYRVAEPFAVFARYSRGARANADRILFSPYVSTTSGGLPDAEASHDPVTQAEVGLKYRQSGLTLNVTGFWAKTDEHNIGLDRSYRAYGAEFEGGLRRGPWSITAGATYTNAKITRDVPAVGTPNTTGNIPKQQPDLIFQTTPQFNSDRFSVGAVIIGTTGSYATDTNQLRMPGFTTVNPFVQFRPVDRVLLSVNCNNLFNSFGIVEVDQATLPTTNVATARVINGRTVSTSLRFNF